MATICYNLDFTKICRICLETHKSFKDLFDSEISNMLEFCQFLVIPANDGLPHQICNECEDVLIQFYNFKQKCISSHDILTKILEGNNIIVDQTTDNDDEYCSENIEFKIPEEIYSCEICDQSFFSVETLQKHNEIHLNPEPDPEISNVDFKLTNSLNESSQGVDPDTHLDNNRPQTIFKCSQCLNSYEYESDLTLHETTHTTKELICFNCGKKFTSRQMLKRHVKIHMLTKHHTCKQCGKGFAEAHSLTKHMRTHLGIPREKNHICKVCGQGFSEPFYLRIHIRKHTGERPLNCSTCEKRFADPRSLKTHMLTHTGEKIHECTICKKSFNQKMSLKKHLRTHTGERPYICTICGKSFAQSSTLHKHSKTHTGEKPFECETCGKRFAEKSSLNCHKKTHEKTPKSILCSICAKSFASRVELKVHLRYHKKTNPSIHTIGSPKGK